MPELPEVETVARQLNQAIAGRRIKHVEIHDAKLCIDSSRLAGCRIEGVGRRGKRVILELIPHRQRRIALWLCVHLRMTGRLLWRPQGDRRDIVPKPRAVFELDRGKLYFADTRRFGTLEVCDRQADVLPAGVDPLSPELDSERLRMLIAGSPTPLKTWLLRQDRLVGIGNIYASEICFSARLNPRRPAGSLSLGEISRLLQAIRRVLRAAIRHCGTTFSDFQDSTGEMGGYAKYLKVYGRKGQPCRVCGTLIEQAVQQQRSTFWCPNCQRPGTLKGR